MSSKQQTMAEKTVVITGASSGVGKAMALTLAKQGARLVLAARRQEALEEVAAECNSLGGNALVVTTDTRSKENLQLLAEKALQFGGAIDVWINNAGVLAVGNLEDIPAEVNEEVIRINLLGYLHSARIVVPCFKMQGYGILINNISMGGWFPVPYGVAYTASKFGLRGFSEALKGELRGHPNIHVCDLYPGFLDTPGVEHAANYTGRVMRPAPPVYDPQKVARAVVSIIRSPRSKVTVGASSTLLRIMYHLFPALSRTMTAFMMRTYFRQAERVAPTNGNILYPVEYGKSIEGGWRTKEARLAGRKAAWLVAGLAGLTAGIMLLRKK